MPVYFTAQMGYVVLATESLVAIGGMRMTAKVLHESANRCAS